MKLCEILRDANYDGDYIHAEKGKKPPPETL